MAGHITKLILDTAARTGGCCTRSTLLAAGLRRSAIDRRIRDGFLQPIASGVYRVYSLDNDFSPYFAATMAVPGSAVSHHSAAVLHGLSIGSVSVRAVHVIAAKGTGRVLDRVTVHESRRFLDDDIVVHAEGFPVTSPCRTVFDLAGHLPLSRLDNLIQQTVVSGIASVDDLLSHFRALARPGVPGLRRLKVALSRLGPADSLSASVLEAKVARCMREYRIAGFDAQYQPPWFDGRRGVVDFAHPLARVIVEADGRHWHGREQAMAEDRRRDRCAAANGWLVIRVTWSDIVDRTDQTMDEIRDAVRARVARRPAA